MVRKAGLETMINLLNMSLFAEAIDRRRIWVEIDQPILIGRNQILRVLENTVDGKHELCLRVDVPGDYIEAPVPADCYMDVSSWSRLLLVPRSVELDEQGRAVRAFIEFVRTSESKQWAV
jgi:hypothetical protein